MHAKKKRGLSQVISTILIIALVVVAVGLISPVIIRIVRNSLEGKVSCFKTMDELKISRENAYNCYDEGSKTVNITISRGDAQMDRFYITLVYKEESKTFATEFIDHNKGSERTYNVTANEKPVKAEIFPEVNGKKCDVTDFITINDC